MSDEQRAAVLARGIGITNLVRRATARADELDREELRAGGQELAAFVTKHRPKVVAIAGIAAYRTAFSVPRALAGEQPADLSGAMLWAVPNPHGLTAQETIPPLAAQYPHPAHSGAAPP